MIKRFYGQGVQVPGASSPGNKLFYTRDHLGSIRELTDTAASVRGRWDYDSYGRRSANLITSGALESDFAYTGHYFHDRSGLTAAPYRFYDADLGKWLSRDPIAENGGINLYGYVGNNPANLIDPLGLRTFDLGITIDFKAFRLGGSAKASVGISINGWNPLNWDLGIITEVANPGVDCPLPSGKNIPGFYIGGDLSIGAAIGSTDANSLLDLEGLGYSAVGDLDVGIGVGGSISGATGNVSGNAVTGGSVNVSLGAGLGVGGQTTNTSVRSLQRGIQGVKSWF